MLDAVFNVVAACVAGGLVRWLVWPVLLLGFLACVPCFIRSLVRR